MCIRDRIVHCATCHNFTQQGEDLCAICQDPGRDQQLLCVVAEASDVLALEMSQVHSGAYHVLGGVLSPQDGVLPDDLKIDALVERVRERRVREVVLALNASAEDGPDDRITKNSSNQRTIMKRDRHEDGFRVINAAS